MSPEKASQDGHPAGAGARSQARTYRPAEKQNPLASAMPQAALLELQRAAGNGAVAKLLTAPGSPQAKGQVQRWIMMAGAIATERPQEQARLDETLASYKAEGLFDEKTGKPVPGKFHYLTDVGEADAQMRAAARGLFGKDLDEDSLAQMSATLRLWMGPVDRLEVHRLGPHADDKVKGNEEQAILGDFSADDSRQYEMRKLLNVRGEMRYYHTYAELAWALHADIKFRRALREEEEVASFVLASSLVDGYLASLIAKVMAKVDGDQSVQDKIGKAKGAPTYGALHGDDTYEKLIASLRGESPGVDGKISRLFDLKAFGDQIGLFKKDETKAFDLKVAGGRDVPGGKTIRVERGGMRYNVSTVDEADPWTLLMRQLNHPTWAGPSFSVAALLQLASSINASVGEKTALAWALFAFWSIRYPHTATAVHRFHEVMAPAQQFGVSYEPTLSVTKNARLSGLRFVL